MAQSQRPKAERRIEPFNVSEGQRVFMGINLHGTSDGQPGVEYDSDIHQAGVEGEVVETPHELMQELMADGERVMANIAVEADDGTVYHWEIDNGYVIGPHQSLGRRSDVGRFGGFYEPSE